MHEDTPHFDFPRRSQSEKKHGLGSERPDASVRIEYRLVHPATGMMTTQTTTVQSVKNQVYRLSPEITAGMLLMQMTCWKAGKLLFQRYTHERSPETGYKWVQYKKRTKPHT